MVEYIDFGNPGGPPLLIEITEREIESSPGILKAGLRATKSSGAVASAQTSLQTVITGTIGQTCAALVEAMNSATRLSGAAEIELEFGLKVTGEVGNLAIGKVGGEANFLVRVKLRDSENMDSE